MFECECVFACTIRFYVLQCEGEWTNTYPGITIILKRRREREERRERERGKNCVGKCGKKEDMVRIDGSDKLYLTYINIKEPYPIWLLISRIILEKNKILMACILSTYM